VVVLAAGGLVFNWASDRRQSQRLIASLEAGSCDFDRDTDPGRDHVASPTFRVDPPSGGDHLAAPASTRTYKVGNMPGDGNLVHSLEPGFLILWHRHVLADANWTSCSTLQGRTNATCSSCPAPRCVHVSRHGLAQATPVHESRTGCPVRFVNAFRNDGPEDIPD
jgi:Protein of unknown function (DUF3105)